MITKDFLFQIFKEGHLTFDTSALSNMFNECEELQLQLEQLIEVISETHIIIPFQVYKEFNCFDHSTKNRTLDKTIKSILFANIVEKWNIGDEEKYATIAEARFKSKVPPGYKDVGKKNDKHKKYGDYFIWQQLINSIKDKERDLLFVINDKKSDWYNKETACYHEDLFKEFYAETRRNIEFISLIDFYRICQDAFNIKLDSLINELDYKLGISDIIQKHFWANEYEIANDYIELHKDDIISQVNHLYDYINDIELLDAQILPYSIRRQVIENEFIQYHGIYSCEVNLELNGHICSEEITLGTASAIIEIEFHCLQQLALEEVEIYDFELTEIKKINVFENDEEPDYFDEYEEPDYFDEYEEPDYFDEYEEPDYFDEYEEPDYFDEF